ncbi:hypothetical protein PP405_11595 [Mycobacteroides abscessus]|nr:hypothetical protein [Mycobacteroides abscessus]MDM2133339.1 hypothetical protein [Mycobacteroides abscessus]MDM2145030.1 hypothetical protein [Mycobacteroides abscessus]MDM2153199.1 hypothetical protein [Mycobacteroides abscessus]MDM2182232.1 hypothetical protein [Mycobacteroides abscessus]
MTVYDAGDAAINIRPGGLSEFRKELDAFLRSVDARLAIALHPNIAQAKADIERWRHEEQAKGVDMRVDARLAEAEAQVARWRASQEANPVRIQIKADQDQANREISRAVGSAKSKALEGLKKDLQLNLKIAGVAGIPSAITGVAGLTSGLVELSQAALLVPGALAGIGSALASLVTGLSGIKEAFSAYGKAQDDSVESTRQAAENQRAAERAARDYSRAQQDVTIAVRDAQNEIRDLNLELKGSALDEADAILNLQQAQEDYAKGGFRTQIEQQRAQLRILQSEQRVEEVRNRNSELAQKTADANARGVAGAPGVVSANDRLASANDAVQAAQQRTVASTLGVEKALAHLSPKAKEFVTDMSAMRGQLREQFKFPAQDALFDGLSAKVKSFVAADLPLITKGFTGINTGINHTIGNLLDSLKSPGGQGILTRILGNTSAAQEQFSHAIDPLVKGLGTLAAAGSDSLPRLAKAFTDVATRFANFIDAADKDGRLAHWIDNGINAARELGHVFGTIGSTLASVSRAFGGDFMTRLDHVTKKMADFFQSSKGQQDLKGIFAQGHAELAKWLPMLKELGPIIGAVFKSAADLTGGWLTVLTPIAGILRTQPGLLRAVVDAVLLWKTITPITRAAGDGFRAMGDFLARVRNETENIATSAAKAESAAAPKYASLKEYTAAIRREAEAMGTAMPGAAAVLQGYYRQAEQGAKNSADAMENNMRRGAKAAEDAAGNETKGVGRFGKAVGALAAFGGPLTILAATAIPLVIDAFSHMNDATDQAAEHARKLKEMEDDLKSSIDAVTGAITAQARLTLADQFQNATLTGGPLGKPELKNALNAAESLGINTTDLVSAAGGDKGKADAIRGKLVDKIKSEHIVDSAASAISGANENVSVDEARDLLARAQIGDKAALDRLSQLRVSSGSESKVDQSFLDTEQGQFSDQGRGSVLLGRQLQDSLNSTVNAQGTLGQKNQAAAGNPTLNPQGQGLFGSGAVVKTDGLNYDVILPGTPTPEQMKQFGEAGRVAQYPAPDNRWYVQLNPETVATDVLRGYDSGGWTPSGKGPGPTGGYIAEVHPEEFVINRDAARRVPSSFLHALNSGAVDTSMLPGYKVGGEVGDDGLGIVRHLTDGLGVLPGPLPGADNDPGSLIPQRLLGGGNQVGAPTNPLDWMNSLPDKVNPEHIAMKAGNILLSGVLGFFGLDNSILSPSNPWNQAIQQTVGGLSKGVGPYAQANPTAGIDMQNYVDGNIPAILQNAAGGAYKGVPSGVQGMSGGSSSAGSVAPTGSGAERWRPIVMKALQEVGPRYGITNTKAWADAMIRQIQTESGGNENAYNGNDTDGKGGHQQVYGLGQFLTSTFNAHNITGGSINSGEAQVYAMIDYVAKRYGMDSTGAPNYIGQGHGYADGGTVIGPTGVDLINANLTAGETVINRSASNRYGTAALASVNAGTARIDPTPTPGGMSTAGAASAIAGAAQPIPIKPLQPNAPIVAPPAGAGPAVAPPSAAAAPSPQPPAAQQPQQPTGPQETPQQGASAQPNIAPAPSSEDHELPALKKGITEGAAQIGTLLQAAAGAGGSMGGGMGAMAGPMIQGATQMGGHLANDVANIFSSALVGNLGDNTTTGAYGAPVVSAPPQPSTINRNTYFGDVSASDPTDFLNKQRLYEQQREQSLVSYVP